VRTQFSASTVRLGQDRLRGVLEARTVRVSGRHRIRQRIPCQEKIVCLEGMASLASVVFGYGFQRHLSSISVASDCCGFRLLQQCFKRYSLPQCNSFSQKTLLAFPRPPWNCLWNYPRNGLGIRFHTLTGYLPLYFNNLDQ
jgi:hypothetical protein